MDNSAIESYQSIIGNEIGSISPCIWSCQFDNYSVLSGAVEMMNEALHSSSQLELLNGSVNSAGEAVLDILDINEGAMRGAAPSSYHLCSLPPCFADHNNFTASSEEPKLINSIPERRKRKWLLPEESCSLFLNSSCLTADGEFQISFGDPEKSKKGRFETEYKPDAEGIAQLKEMVYLAAALRPVGSPAESTVEKPRRKNVRISCDPQTAAARRRRERISERLRVLQRLVPGGSKLDTASMLDEAANYLKFLKTQVSSLEKVRRTAFSHSVSPMETLFQVPN